MGASLQVVFLWPLISRDPMQKGLETFRDPDRRTLNPKTLRIERFGHKGPYKGASGKPCL